MANEVRVQEGLTAKQLNFAVNYVANGGNATKAAVDAGYSEVSARVQACGLLNLPHVAAAIQRETFRAIGRHGPAMLDVLVTLAIDDAVPPGVRAKCAATVLDRGGFQPPKRSDAGGDSEKPLQRMNKQELEQAIGAIGQALAAARQTTLDAAVNAAGEAEVIDIIEVDPT
jgi:hypothetical protein